MPGLNYGYSFRKGKQMPEGVVFAKRINKWLVRVKGWNGNISTKAKFDTEAEGIKLYEELTNKA